jgi:lysozyme
MRVSKNFIKLVELSEGLELKPYLCPAGVPTIGWGSTRYPDGRRVTLQDKPITRAEADTILIGTIGEYEEAVNRYVKVPINQNQFDALVDFAYNAGAKNLLASTLLKKLNSGDYVGAANEFDKWVFGGGVKLNGLVTRRSNEKALFLKQA